MARRQQVCCMCRRRCHRIDAIALAHLSQRVHCLASQEMTASSAPAYVLTVPTELLASGRSWLSLHLALAVGFGVSCAIRVSVQTVKHASWAYLGPRPRFVAQSLRWWACLHAEQRSSMCTADRATAFVGLRCRVVRSSAVIRYLAEHV